MANTYTQTYYYIVFSTKNRAPCIYEPRRKELYAYIWGINKELKCHLYRIGGVHDHVHLLAHVRPAMALSAYVEKIKTGSSNWIRREKIYADWPGWQDGYGAFTLSINERDDVIAYIVNQEEHHKTTGFLEEYRLLLTTAGIQFDEKYLA